MFDNKAQYAKSKADNLARRAKIREAKRSLKAAHAGMVQKLLGGVQRKLAPNAFKGYKPLSPLQAMVHKLTNWQRGRWSAAGYPGLRHQNTELVKPYTEMRRSDFI